MIVLCVVHAIVLFASGGAPAESGGAKERPPARERTEANLKRWHDLSPERREGLLRLYERLRETIPPKERERFFQRLRQERPEKRKEIIQRYLALRKQAAVEREQIRAWNTLIRKLVGSLPPAEQKRFRQMAPETKRALVHKLIDEQWNRIIPASERERWKGLPRAERHRRFREFRDRELSGSVLRPREIKSLRGTPPEKVRRILVPGKPLPPERFSQESRDRWGKLRPPEQERIRRFLSRPPLPPPAPGRLRPDRPGGPPSEGARPPAPGQRPKGPERQRRAAETEPQG